MFRFNYNYTDYGLLISDLAGQLHVPVISDRIDLPPNIATGYFYFLKLPNEIHTNVISVNLNTRVELYREAQEEEYYTLRFDQLETQGQMQLKIADTEIEEGPTSRSVAYLTSSRFDWKLSASAGTSFNSVNALFSREWLATYLGLKTVEDCLGTYIKMKTFHLSTEPLDSEYRRLLDEITSTDADHPLRLAIVQNRIMLLIERFFSRLHQKLHDAPSGLPLAENDINRMMRVEQELVADLYRKPPPIDALARQYAISPTKLKKDFKLVFGHPVYEYFQRARMNAARDQLKTGRYSVKEMALNLGYSNMSNFTIAFRKAVGSLPSQVLKENAG